jgi:hypothetical protein
VKIADLQKIYDCYEQDPEHIEKHHIGAGSGIDFCVSKTFETLEKDGAEINEVTLGGDVVGLFSSVCLLDSNLMQFWFVNPKFRNKNNLLYFWKIVSEYFGGCFFTAIYPMNSKAYKHLKKQGFEIIYKDKEKILFKCH